MAALALFGGFVGLAIAAATVVGERAAEDVTFLEALGRALSGNFQGDFVAMVGAAGFVIGGVVIGGYGGVLLARIGRSSVTCPECGTRNAVENRVCIACEADLTKAGSRDG